MTVNRECGCQVSSSSSKTSLSVVIQAGGESRRMGRDKALVPFLGRPMIERIIERVSPVADEIVITSNTPETLAYLGLPVFRDVMDRRGALNGLLTALSVARFEYVSIVACDMVFASSKLLAAEYEELLAGDADAAVPVTGHGFEPFHAVYRKSTCMPVVLRAIENGDTRANSWYSEITIAGFDRGRLDAIGLDGPVFVNANTPDELVAAENLARHLALREASAETESVQRSFLSEDVASSGQNFFAAASSCAEGA